MCQVFGLATLGRMTGFIFTSSSLVGLLQFPLVSVTNHRFQGDPRPVSAALEALTALVFLLLLAFGRRYQDSNSGSSSSGLEGQGMDSLSPALSAASAGAHTPLMGTRSPGSVVSSSPRLSRQHSERSMTSNTTAKFMRSSSRDYGGVLSPSQAARAGGGGGGQPTEEFDLSRSWSPAGGQRGDLLHDRL